MPPLSSTCADFSNTSTHGKAATRHGDDMPHKHIAKKQQKRSVSFNPVVCGRRTMHIHDFSIEEKTACWYTAAENREMKKQIIQAIHELDRDNEKEDSDEFCSRGLFRHLPHVAQERSAVKRQARQVVLDEQQLQREEGSSDPEFIAMIYAETSLLAQELACDQGDRDEWDAWMC